MNDNKIFLSFAIPTYNRDSFLEKLLTSILPQVEEFKGDVEVCIYNNSSTDNTRQVVETFIKKYPGIIKYQENNTGSPNHDNVINLSKMTSGNFVWFFGDDDSIIPKGFKEVVDFIKKNSRKNTGLVVLKDESYFIDKKTGEKIIYYSSLEPNRPLSFKIDRKNIIGANFPDCSFMSVLIFNNDFLKPTLEQEKGLIEKAKGEGNIFEFLYRLMFLKHSKIEGITFNKKIVLQEMPYYKYYIEDKFRHAYVGKKRMNDLLKRCGYATGDDIGVLNAENKKLRKNVVQHIIMMKTFKTFRLRSSYTEVLKSFLKQAGLWDGLRISAVFLLIYITPSFFLQNALKFYFFLKYGKNRETHWLFCETIHSRVSQGTREVNLE